MVELSWWWVILLLALGGVAAVGAVLLAVRVGACSRLLSFSSDLFFILTFIGMLPQATRGASQGEPAAATHGVC